MAERRMFAKTIIDSDAFLDMPMSARLLYYDLGMRADDDGFVNSPKKIMKMIGATNDDMNILIMRKFVIAFQSGVIVIKHWRINNYLRSDRYHETQYIEEKSQLTVDEKGKYHAKNNDGIPCGIPNTVDSGKDRLGKDSIGNNISISNEIDTSPLQSDNEPKSLHKDILDAWNNLQSYGIRPMRSINPNSKRADMLRARIKQYGKDAIFEAMEKVKESDFLQGKTKRYGEHKNWTFDFDWFIRPNNFPSVLEGKYSNKNQGVENDWGF